MPLTYLNFLTDFTVGSVIFVGPGPVLAEDPDNFVWNDATNSLILGTRNSNENSIILRYGTRLVFDG